MNDLSKVAYMVNEDLESLRFNEMDEELIKDAELFSTGTHRGVTYTEEDLKRLTDSFDAKEGVPVQLDHSNSARDTVGFLQEVSVKGGKLLGRLKILDEDARKRVKSGLFKKLSVSFYLEGGKPSKIREVSLVAFPQVKSARLFAEDGNSILNYNDNGGSKMNGLSEKELTRIGELINKALDHSQGSLNEAEVKELHALLKRFETSHEEAKKDSKRSLSEVIDSATTIAFAKQALKVSEQVQFDRLPLSEKFSKLKKELDGLQKSPYMKALLKERKKQEEKEAFERFYEEHARKHGRSL
ncbi:hypothetical protein ACQKM1_09435 [Peribacillus frigoritolerans]|uniref:hypothetical protein n=1 Tax=Peribacillus frigoritolerans TaxID=450367 RepID=UPI003CFC153C